MQRCFLGSFEDEQEVILSFSGVTNNNPCSLVVRNRSGSVTEKYFEVDPEEECHHEFEEDRQGIETTVGTIDLIDTLGEFQERCDDTDGPVFVSCKFTNTNRDIAMTRKFVLGWRW